MTEPASTFMVADGHGGGAVDVNIEIDDLVVDGDADAGTLAEQVLSAAGGALASGTATQVSQAVLAAVSERRGSAGPNGEGRMP